MTEHLTDKVCSCKYCTAIDVMFGDPLLNSWESKFITSVGRQGGQRDYSPKEKAIIEKIFKQQRHKYLNQKGALMPNENKIVRVREKTENTIAQELKKFRPCSIAKPMLVYRDNSITLIDKIAKKDTDIVIQQLKQTDIDLGLTPQMWEAVVTRTIDIQKGLIK